MAYVPGLYTRASEAGAAEATRFRQFQTDIDEMAARERAGLMRQQVAQMDQFTAGLTPKSDVAVPDWAAPAAPPAVGLNTYGSGGARDSGAAAGSSYERDRLMQERKLVETQYNTEIGAQKSYLDTLGKRKYILEQQLNVAPPNMQPRIRSQIDALNVEISKSLTGARERVTTYTTLFEKLDKAIRDADKGRAIMSGVAPASPGVYTPRTDTGNVPQLPGGMGAAPQPIPVPQSLEMLPNAAQPTAPGATPAPAPGATPAPAPGATPAPAPGATGAATTESWVGKVGGIIELPGFGSLTIPQVGAYDASTPAGRGVGRAQAEKAFNFALDTVRRNWYTGGYGNPMPNLAGSAFGMFADVGPEADARTKSYAVSEWLNSSATEQLIRSDVEAFKAIVADPEAAYDRYKGKTDLGPVPAGVTPPVTSETAAPAPAGVSPPVTPEAAAAATPALTTPEVSYSDPAIASTSAAKLEAEFLPRAAQVGAVVQSADGQRLIQRARELGVDPAIAVAIYGVETNFGQQVGTSAKGAFGLMQVIPATFADMKRVFTDPAEIKRLKIPQALVEAAKNLDPNDETSFDAGLLRLKYAELVGVPKNLIGAGYNASAEKVRDAGAPLDAFDGGLTNSDYNKAFVTLYNEARQYVNVPPKTSTSLEGVLGNSENLRQIELQEAQVSRDYAFAVDSLNTERQATISQRNDLIRRMEVARQFNDVAAYEQAAANLDAIDQSITDINRKMYEAETIHRTEYNKFNLARTNEYINMAVRELDAGNPAPFSEVVSRGTGMLIEIQPMENGKFAVYQNNQLVSGKGYTLKQVKDQYLSPISASYEAQRAAIAEEERKFNSEQLSADLKLARDATLESIKASGKMQEQGWTEGKESTDDTGRIVERWYSKGNRVIRMRIAPDREENGLVVKGGVVVEEVKGLR